MSAVEQPHPLRISAVRRGQMRPCVALVPGPLVRYTLAAVGGDRALGNRSGGMLSSRYRSATVGQVRDLSKQDASPGTQARDLEA